jgi:hypothetical protein
MYHLGSRALLTCAARKEFAMEVILILFVIGAIIVVVKVVRTKPQPTPSTTPPPPPPPPSTWPSRVGVPTFKVVVVGPPGSGKTLLLASLFNQLNYLRGGRSYYLRASPEQRLTLSAVYRTLSDTRQGWPHATRVSEFTDYRFDCVAVDPDRRQHHVLSLSYLDYAGELLDNPHAGPATFRELNEHISSAQTLLGMIDGEFLVRLLRNEAAGRNYFEFEMRTIFGLLQEARCPIHLVISKWDLVRNFGEPDGADDQLRLAAAITALRRFPQIESLVSSGSGQFVRIIPVSAVGPVFAQFDSVGTVVKRPDGQVHPRNVEVPLCAVVPDLFRQVERQLDDARRREIDAMHAGSRFRATEVLSGVAAFFTQPVGVVLRVAMTGVAGGEIANEVSRMFVEWAARPYANAIGRRQQGRQEGVMELDRFRAAREQVFYDFEKVVRGLESALPNSELARSS